MSEEISLPRQIKFMESVLATRETSYPIQVKMKRMTQEQANDGIAKVKAVLQTLRKAHTAGGIAAQALKEMQPQPTISVGRLARFQTAVTEIHRCAKANSEMCSHCQSIANLLGEMGSIVE